MNTSQLKYAIPGTDQFVNSHLVMKHGLSDAQLAVVTAAHGKLEALLASLEHADIATLRAAVPELEAIEREVQTAWKFPDDPKFRRHWFRIPRCSCRESVNMAVWGQGVRFVARDCAVHEGQPAPEGILVLPDRMKGFPL